MTNFRIDRIQINHLGAFEALDLTFKEKPQNGLAEIHILTGENGTGKSTILQAFSYMQMPYRLTPKVHLRNKDTAGFELQFSYDVTFKMEATATVRTTQVWRQAFNNGQWNGSVNPNGGIIDYFNKWGQYQYQSFGFAIFAYSGYRRLENSDLNSIRELQENPFENSLDFTNSINPNLLLQWIANTKTKAALAFTRGDLPKFNQFENAIKRIEKVVSDITGWDILFKLSDSPLKVEVNVNGVDLDFSLLPDGLKSIISWIADLLMRMDRLSWVGDIDPFERNFILLLDEIEVHLHPAWQRKVLPIIQSLFKNAQIIISSHSPFVTNSIDNAWIYKLKKIGTYSKLDAEPVLSENGKSYRTILEEVFGVNEEFGMEVEEDLDSFYKLKTEILVGKRSFQDNEFQSLANNLSQQSVELESIIGMELQQIKKRLQLQ